MDEDYLSNIYNGLGGEDFFGKYDDFTTLITSDNEYRKNIHNHFGKNVLGTFNDFTQLTTGNAIEEKGNYYGDEGIIEKTTVTTPQPDAEWKPKYASSYYKSLPLMDEERSNFEEWLEKDSREALPEEVEAERRKKDTEVLDINQQIELGFNVPLQPIEVGRDPLTEDVERRKNYLYNDEEYLSLDRYVNDDIPIIEEEEEEDGYYTRALDFIENDPRALVLPPVLGMKGLELLGDGVGSVLDGVRYLIGKPTSIVGATDTEIDASDETLKQRGAQLKTDQINKAIRDGVGTKVIYIMEDGQLTPHVSKNTNVTKADIVKTEQLVRDHQSALNVQRLSDNEQKIFYKQKELEELPEWDDVRKKELTQEIAKLSEEEGGSNKIFAEDGSYIDKSKATPSDKEANESITQEAKEQYILTDLQSMIKAQDELSMKILYLATEIDKDPDVIDKGMSFLEVLGDAYQEWESEGNRLYNLSFLPGFGDDPRLKEKQTRDIGLLGAWQDEDLIWKNDKEIIKKMVEGYYVDPSLSYLPGKSNVATKFNDLLHQYNVVNRAIQLNMDPTQNVDNDLIDNLATTGAGFAEFVTPSRVETDRSDARAFINFAKDDVGINISERQLEILEGSAGEIAAHTIPEVTKIMGEFFVARKMVGPARIKQLGSVITALGANKPKIVRRALNVSAAIIEEAVAIQAVNTAIRPVTGEEDMSLTWAVGAGVAGSFFKYFSPEAIEGIWTANNKVVNRLITTIGSSETAKMLSSQLIQPAIGTGVMIAGEISEGLLKGRGFSDTMKEALLEQESRTGEFNVNWDKLIGTWGALWAMQIAKAPVNIVRQPLRAIEADILALGKKTRFTKQAAKELGIESNYVEKDAEGNYKITEDYIQQKYREKIQELANDKTLSSKEKSEKFKKLNKSYRQLNNHRQYLDVKKAITDQQGGKQLWADQYVANMNLGYGRKLSGLDIEALGNTPSAKLTKLLVEDPYNPLSSQKNSQLANYIYKVRKYAETLSSEANLIVASQGGLRGKARTKYFDEALKRDNVKNEITILDGLLKKKKISEKIYNEKKGELEKQLEGIESNIDKITDDFTTELKSSDKFKKISKPIIEKAKEAGFEIIEDKTLEGEAEIGGGKFKYNPDKAPEFFTLGVHEVGHPIVNKMLEGKTQAEKDSFVQEFKKILPEKTYRMIEERLLGRQNVKDYKENPNTVEWMNVFLDLTSSGALKYEGNFFDKVGDFLNKYKKGKDYSLDLNFESPKEVYENLKAFAEAAGKGKAAVGEKGEMLVEALKKAPQMEGVQRSMTEKEINKFTKTEEGKPMTQVEWFEFTGKMNDKGDLVNQEKIGKAFEGLINSKIKGDKNQPGWIFGDNAKKDIIDDFKFRLRKKGFYDRKIEEFNPEKNDNFSGYMSSIIHNVYKDVLAANKKTIPTVSRDIQVEGKTMPEAESKDLDPSQLADIALEKERKAKAAKNKPKETIASKVGMPLKIKERGKEIDSEKYIETAAEKVDYRKLPEISTPPGPNQTIPPFLSKLKSQIATSRKYKEEVAQSMGTRKDYMDYLDKNFEKIVKNLPPSYFSGLIEREIKSGKEVSLPKNLIQKDTGKGYTSNWQGKKAVGTKAAKTGITSGLQRIRLNPNFDFKSKANIEAFQKAFKSQGRKEGLAGQVAAKGVIDYLQEKLGTGSKIDRQLKDIYELQGRELPKDYATQFKQQIAKSEVERSFTDEKKLRQEEIQKRLSSLKKHPLFIKEMQGMANAIKTLADKLELTIPKEIGKDGTVRDPIGQQKLYELATNILPLYYGESILSGSTWSNTKLGKGMWFSSDLRSKALSDFRSNIKNELKREKIELINSGMKSPGLDPMKTSSFKARGKESKWIENVDKNYKGLDLFVDQTFKMLKENPDFLGEFLAMMKGSSAASTHFWRNFAQVIGKDLSWNIDKQGGIGEHALVQNQAGEFMTKAVLESIARDNPKAKNIAKELLNENYFQILISHANDGMLKQIGLQSSMPKGFWESWNKAVETGNIKEAWSVWSRYFNPKINKIKNGKGEFGFNPNEIILLNRKTGAIESLADIFGIGEKQFGRDILNPEIIAKQQELIGEWAIRNPKYNTIKKLREHLAIELDMLNSKRDATLESKTEIEKIDNIFKISEKASNEMLVQKSNTFDKALDEGKKIEKPIKKARVFDFDDTIAKSKSKVLYETIDGKKGELTPEQFAERGERLKEEEGAIFDFSEFNEVKEGKKGPLFEVFKKMKEAVGDRDMFILTARAPESAIAIQKFLKEMGVDIPLDHITGLGDSSPLAKSDWVVGKAAEGYNDFYFADDHLPNVNAVKKVLNQLDVKGKVQQAIMQKSNTLNDKFNEIIEQKKGIGKEKVFSDIKAEIRGAEARRQRFFIPPSAEDFRGLLYTTLPKGAKGEKALEFYKESLLDPYSRAMENLSTDRINLMNDFKALKKELDVPKDLKKQTESGFTNAQAVRVHLWNKTGKEIPGLSKADLKELNDIVEKDFRLKSFADQILAITKGDGYSTPTKNWNAGTITTDLIDVLNTTKRSKYLETWKQNADIIFSKDNLNKLEAAFGKKYREAVENSLKRMKSGSNRIAGGNKLSNQVLDYINNSTAVTMFMNTRSALLQTISAANFINWSFNSPYHAGKAFANQPQYWKDFTKLMNSDYLVDRRNGLKLNINESEIANAAKTSKNKAKAALNYILEKGYLPTKFADSFAIASGGATWYRNKIKDLMKDGLLTEKEAEAIAMKEFRDISEMSQQSSDPSKISSQQSSDIGRIILQYVNTPMQYARIQKRDIQDIANKRRMPGKTLAQSNRIRASRIAYYMFLQNMMFNALQQGLFAIGFGDDEMDEKDEKSLFKTANGMLDSSLRGLGLAGVTVQVIKNLGIDIYDRSQKSRPEYSDAWIKLLEFSPAVKSKLSKLRSAAWPFDSKKRRAEVFEKGFSLDNPAYESMAKVISAASNVPLDRLYSKINNLKAAASDEAEAWQSIAMILGWPEWQIMEDDKPKSKSKAVNASKSKRSRGKKRKTRKTR